MPVNLCSVFPANGRRSVSDQCTARVGAISLHNANDGFAAEWVSEISPLVRKCSGSYICSMHPVTPAGALVGRESEMPLLAGMVKEVSLGRGGAVLIEASLASGSPPSLVRSGCPIRSCDPSCAPRSPAGCVRSGDLITLLRQPGSRGYNDPRTRPVPGQSCRAVTQVRPAGPGGSGRRGGGSRSCPGSGPSRSGRCAR